jgi:glycine oxidase
MGARHDWWRLRGVRGEIVRLFAPEIELDHLLRLLHPRYPVYIIPRAEGRLVVRSTSIESDDPSPVSVRGALELLTSAFSVLPALAEARILEFNTQVRPALPDNAPAIRFDRQRETGHINGLYRHGFLLTPAIVEEVLALRFLREPSTLVGRWSCGRRCRAPQKSGAPSHRILSVTISAYRFQPERCGETLIVATTRGRIGDRSRDD